MPYGEPTWLRPRFRDFTGGENLKVLPEAVAPNQVFRAQNCVITDEGLLETRLGRVKINTTSLGAGGIVSAHRYTTAAGVRYILAQHGTKLYAQTWDGATPFSTFPAAVKTGLTAAKKLRSVAWKGKLILTNGTDQAFTFDGTVCTDVAAIPKCKALYLYAGRLWCVDEATGFLENSNLEDYTNWTDSGSYLVRDGEGDSIVALSPQNGGMVIFKQNSAQTLYGTNKNNIQIAEPFSRRIGCVAIDSVLEDGFFMGKDNFYTFTLNSIDPLPETHTPFISELTLAQKQAAFSVPHVTTRRGLVSLNGTAFCMHQKWNGAVTSWIGLNASCFAVADDKDDTGVVITGDATNGFLYTLTGDNDSGAVIETRIKSAYDDHGESREKEWSSFIPEVEALDEVAYRMYYNYDLDFARSGGMLTNSYKGNALDWGVDKWLSATWGSEFRINEPFFLHDARGNRISFEVICNNRIRFNGYTTKYRKVGAVV